jgi:hypothetical protein
VPLVDMMVQVMDVDDEQTVDDGCYRGRHRLRDPAIVARFVARALSNQRRLRAMTGGDTRNQCGWSLVGRCMTMYRHSGSGYS